MEITSQTTVTLCVYYVTVLCVCLNALTITSPSCRGNIHFTVHKNTTIDTGSDHVTIITSLSSPKASELFVACSAECCFLGKYYGRKKYPDPPIINTDITHMSCRNFQCSFTLDCSCLRYMHRLAYRMA